VGDAGGHTIPTVGGGIPPGLIVGRVAGQVAADHVLEGTPLEEYEGAWRSQLGDVLENSLRLRRMSDTVFRDRRLIEVATRLNWLTKKTINNFIYCRIDPEIRLIEEALRRGRLVVAGGAELGVVLGVVVYVDGWEGDDHHP